VSESQRVAHPAGIPIAVTKGVAEAQSGRPEAASDSPNLYILMWVVRE